MEWNAKSAVMEMLENKILVNTYYNQNMKLPVLSTDGNWKDISGYYECYWSRDDFYFFHMPNELAIVAHIGVWNCEEPWHHDDSWENSIAMISNSKYGIERKRYRECISNELDLRNMQFFFNGFEYVAFNHEGRVVILNYHSGKYLEFNTGETIKYYIHTSPVGYFITDEGYLCYREKCLKELGKININPTLGLKGTYFITENGDLYKETYIWNYALGHYGLIKDSDKTINGFKGKEYYAFHYENGDVVISSNNTKQFSPFIFHDIKKAVFTDSHILLLHNDGTVSFKGRNKNRCCSKLERFKNVLDIDGTDDSSIIVLNEGVITLP